MARFEGWRPRSRAGWVALLLVVAVAVGALGYLTGTLIYTVTH
jgi:uncharacterized protein involved in exopolysaccharide biosynthesis